MGLNSSFLRRRFGNRRIDRNGFRWRSFEFRWRSFAHGIGRWRFLHGRQRRCFEHSCYACVELRRRWFACGTIGDGRWTFARESTEIADERWMQRRRFCLRDPPYTIISPKIVDVRRVRQIPVIYGPHVGVQPLRVGDVFAARRVAKRRWVRRK